MKKAVAILALALALGACAITSDTEFQDIPGTATVGEIVEAGGGGGGGGGVTPTEAERIAGRVTSNVVTKAYVEGLGISSGGISSGEAERIANEAVVTNKLTVATTNAVASKADRTELAGYVPWANDDHNAVAIGFRAPGSTIGWCSLAQGDGTRAEGENSHAEGASSYAEGFYSHAEGFYSHAEGYASHAEGDNTHAEGYASHAEGENSHANGQASYAGGYKARTGHDYAYAWQGIDSIGYYNSHGNGTFNINPVGGLYGFWIGEQTLGEIFDDAEQAAMNYTDTATNALAAIIPLPYTPDENDYDFSNAVMSVVLPIGTNELAVLRDIGGLPIGEGAATVGGLLAALAATVAWLKRNKITNPDGGAVGNVLTKTADGVEWGEGGGGDTTWCLKLDPDTGNIYYDDDDQNA